MRRNVMSNARKSSSKLLAALVITFSAVALSACANEPEPTVEEKNHSAILSMQLPADVSATGVMLAALLLSTSDIEAALAEGLVTPAEVSLAQEAIDDGLLNHWRQRAEQEVLNE